MKNGRSEKAEVLQGTLILLVLRTLETLGAQHGYGIARRIEQISEDVLQLNQGTLYPALLRMEQEGWISSKWGPSEKNRKAKYYSITAAGRRQLTARRPRCWGEQQGGDQGGARRTEGQRRTGALGCLQHATYRRMSPPSDLRPDSECERR